MDKAQIQERIEYFSAHKGEAFIHGLDVVKLVGIDETSEEGLRIVVYDDHLKKPVFTDFYDSHLIQLKGIIDEDEYGSLQVTLDTNFSQYLRMAEPEKELQARF